MLGNKHLECDKLHILNEAFGAEMNFYLQRLQDDISAAIAGAQDADLLWHPDGKWSISEILEHLYLTYTGTTKGFERCLSAGRPIARKPNLRDIVQTAVVIRCGYLPNGRQAPKQVTPRGLPADQVRVEILARIADMDAIIERAIRVYGAQTRLVDHPILGPLRGYEWCKFHWVHGHHHVKQIQWLREASASRA
jgi:hypothetical protein